MGRITVRHKLERMTPAGDEPRIDTLAVEEPLDIRLDGAPFQVTMRTPGHDIDLVHGLLFAEGVISSRVDLRAARYPPTADGEVRYNLLDIALAGTARPDAVAARRVTTTSACGICGVESLEQL